MTQLPSFMNNNAALLGLMYNFNSILSKIPGNRFMITNRLILRHIWKCKSPALMLKSRDRYKTNPTSPPVKVRY